MVGFVQQKNQVYRITSYNVCYTKLLRIVLDTVKARFNAVACNYEGVPQQTLLNNENGALNEIKAGRKVQFTSRITSYNVCYTKLLRYKIRN